MNNKNELQKASNCDPCLETTLKVECAPNHESVVAKAAAPGVTPADSPVVAATEGVGIDLPDADTALNF